MLVGDVIDHAVRNIITLILVFTGLVSLLIWFLKESTFAPRVKKTVAVFLVLSIIFALASLRIEGVSGDLVPEFAFRWQARRDSLLPSAATLAYQSSNKNMSSEWTATADDFPCFLGPEGTASLDGVELDTNWQANPPQCIWRRPIGAGWSGFATYGNHAVTLEQRGNDESISCYALETGEPEWVVSVPARHETVLGGIGPRSTPTIRDGVVYATGATGWLHAIEGSTGKILWRKDIVADLGIDRATHASAVAWGRSGSPLVTENLVITPAGGPRKATKLQDVDSSTVAPTTSPYVSLVAYDRTTGDLAWLAGTEQIAYASPQMLRLNNQNVVATVNEGHVAAYDLTTGNQLWEFEWPGHSNSDASCSQPHLFDGNRLFISKGYGIGSAVFSITHSGSDWSISDLAAVKPTEAKFTNVLLMDMPDSPMAFSNASNFLLGRRGNKDAMDRTTFSCGDVLLIQAESGEVVAVPATPEKPAELVASLHLMDKHGTHYALAAAICSSEMHRKPPVTKSHFDEVRCQKMLLHKQEGR